MRCILWHENPKRRAFGGRCGCEALPGDCMCAEHVAYFRGRHVERCVLCGRRLVGPMSHDRGECVPSCEERACDEALARKARNDRRPKRTRRCDRTRRLPGPGPEGSMET